MMDVHSGCFLISISYLFTSLLFSPTAYRAAERFFKRGTKTSASDAPLEEERSPKRVKTHHNNNNEDVHTIFVTPERPSKQQLEEEGANARTEEMAIADAKAKEEEKKKAIALAKAKAEKEARAKLLAEFDFVQFEPVGKKRLERGELSKKLDGLYDRQQSIEDFYRALENVATSMRQKSAKETMDESESHGTDDVENAGDTNEDCVDDSAIAPFIAVHGKEGVGKTEFLRWIFNHCCTFQGKQKTAVSKALLQRLNQALPTTEKPLENILVLYASYKGESAHSTNEGPICGTTVERLLRSFHGITEFRDDYPAKKRVRYEHFSKGQHIIDTFTRLYGKTGFVFLLDDLSELREANESEYRELLDSILEFSQNCLDQGTLCAVVGSSTSPFELCDTIINHCKKVVQPISFPRKMPDLEATIRKFLSKNLQSDQDHNDLSFSIAMKLLQSMSCPSAFEDFLSETESRKRIKSLIPKQFRIPDSVSPEYVFSLAARNLLGVEATELLERQTIEDVVNHLSGHVVFETDASWRLTEWKNSKDWCPSGTLSLPAWRLFQFHTSFNQQLFPQVHNWVWVESRKLFFDYGPTEDTRTLEIGTMSLLELRKAMLQSVNGSPPSLKELFNGIHIQHNLSNELLVNSKASSSATKLQCFGALPYSFEVVTEPTLYLSGSASNQKGIEGILKGCFDGVTIFFRTRTYAAGCPDELCDWLVNAHKRAFDLGYRQGDYIVQLFVPGDGGANLDEESSSSNSSSSDTACDTSKWPANSMVFSDEALMDIFQPFIKLTLY